MSVTAVQQLQFSYMVKGSRRIPRLVDNEIVFAAIPHIAEAAVVQPDQQLTPASGSEITVSVQRLRWATKQPAGVGTYWAIAAGAFSSKAHCIWDRGADS